VGHLHLDVQKRLQTQALNPPAQISAGRQFEGCHGDGVLSTVAGYEGNATCPDWPGIHATTANGVTGATGSGFRGGAFDDELADLKIEILKIGTMVEESIFKSVEALKKMSAEEAKKIIADDKIIDALELKIDEKCLDLLALQQPMAVDLRFIAMAMNITTDLERMADLAVDIAQRVLEIADKPLLKPLVDIPRLAVIARKMTRDVIQAFINKDADSAMKVILSDPEADQLRNAVQKELINDYMAKDGSTAPRAVPLLLIARHLERICDHATNIAEDVIYMVNAEVVKHHPERLKN